MVLNNLVIQGFKSFPDKTVIDFHQGLTAVVGPNGSGKSNISDAIRWVMGEQSSKTLRGGKMEDVIFSGTKNRKAMTFAEVSLSINNQDRSLAIDEDEVIVTRRYSRSGDSEYRINQKQVRLKDLNELFMDTGMGKDGYAMIGQGRISEIVQSKSDERRLIFEEAAGISKFRSRKQDAERRLNAAEENLVRLRDILQELEDRLGPLKEQSEKAKKYLELAGRKKEIEISVWMQRLGEYQRQLKDLDDRKLAKSMELEDAEEELRLLSRKMEEAQLQMERADAALDGFRREQEEKHASQTEWQARLAVLENDRIHAETEKSRLLKEKDSLMQRLEDQEQSIQTLKTQIEACEELIRKTNEEIRTEERFLQEMEEQKSAAEDIVSETEQKLQALVVRQSIVQNSLLSIRQHRTEEKDQLELLQRNQTLQEEELKRSTEELQQHQQFEKDLNERIEELKNMAAGFERRLESRSSALQSARDAEDSLRMKIRESLQRVKLLEDLEKNMEGYSYSVRTVMKRAKSGMLAGICGTVSQILDVPDSYTVAVETALGAAQQNIIVESDQNAKSAIRFLQQQNSGRATFLPLNAVRGGTLQNRSLEDEFGFVALASELVRYDEKYRPAVEFLLGRIAVCEDLDSAVYIARKYQYKFRVVTLDGQVINAGGSMTGGSQNKSAGFFSRKTEIQSLNQKIETMQKEAAGKTEATALANQKYLETRAEKRALESELQTVREDQIRAEGEILRLQQLADSQKQNYVSLGSRIQQAKDRQKEYTEQEEALNLELQELKQNLGQMQADSAAFEEKTRQTLQRVQQHQNRCSELRLIRLERQKDLENAQSRLSDFTLQGNQLEDQLNQLDLAIDEQEKLHRELETQKTETRQQMEQLLAALDQLKEQMAETAQCRQDNEAKMASFRNEEKEISVRAERLRQETEHLSDRMAGIQKNQDDLIRKLWDEYELSRAEAAELAVDLEDLDQAQKELNSLRTRIRNLGNVNVGAVEEYREVSERYHFLHDQVTDAEKARAELLRLIGELTDEMKTLFRTSFENINTHFKRIFVELFGGGKAELRLTDPEDLLGCGIDLMVEPPGKIFRNLASLSGGEQSFTAIALYFAILNVRPSPFCVLDEIEAALDDVNVSKFAAYLRQLTDRTQFIAITHRRGTMEEADTLYGVTMQQEGVSKLLQLKVSEIEKTMASIGTN